MSIQETRSGETLKTHGLVLRVTPFQERDLVFDVLTLDYGRLGLLGRSAAKSQKRFGGCKDPLTHVVAHLKVNHQEGLWRAESFELQSFFPHLRSHYELLESAMLGAGALRELLPEHQKDVPLFQFFGRWLRDVPSQQTTSGCRWYRTLLLVWLAHHWGHGLLRFSWSADVQKLLESVIRDSQSLSVAMSGLMTQDMTASDELALYKLWSQQTGLAIVVWEKWLQTQVISRR